MSLHPSHLHHSPSIIQFPSIVSPRSAPKESCLLKQQQFWPVLKTKRYNILKLHQLKHHHDKDKRLGRLSSQRERLRLLALKEEQQVNNSINYFVMRDGRNRKINNSNFINMVDQIKQNNRYRSLQR